MYDLYVYRPDGRLSAHIQWDYYAARQSAKLHLVFCSWGVGSAPEDFVLGIAQGIANKFGENVKVSASWALSGRLDGATLEFPLTKYTYKHFRNALLARLREYGEVKHFYVPSWGRW